MNWKTRQMFSDREHGLVSGLSPINMMGGGSVPMPGYKHGGLFGRRKGRKAEYTPSQALLATPAQAGAMAGAMAGAADVPEELSIEQQVAALAAQQGISVPEARARILNQMLQERGVTLSEEVINQFATGIITLQDALAQAQAGIPRVPGMQDGGVALDLFEEGDQDINEALNMMSGSVSPPLSDVGPTAPTGATETIEETVTVTEDQGSGEYQVELQALKEAFLNDIRFYATNSGTTELGEYLKKMNIAYFNELEKLKEKHGIEGITTGEELITNEFLQELMSIANPEATSEIPAFENGGVVGSAKEIKTKEHLLALGINVPLHIWEKLSDERKDLIFSEQMARNIFGGAGTTAPDTSRLDALLARREGLAGDIGKATRGSYSSYLPRVLHYGAAKRAGQLAEAEAMDKVLADQIATERTLLGTTGRGSSERLGQQWKDAFSGVTKQPDTLDMYKTAIKDFQDEGFVGNVRALAIIALADDFAPPPRALAIYQGTVTLPTGETLTWPEFYHKFIQATLDRHLKTLQDQGSKLTSIEHGSDEYYDALMPLILQWQKAVSKSQ